MASKNDASLAERLSNPARPVFLLGDVPPGEGTPPGKCQTICNKFQSRSRALASDGFIVYDIQDEPGRSDITRPFPFRRVMDSSAYAALLARSSGKDTLVYKCVADPHFERWLNTATTQHGHSAINLVGRATSSGDYQGPTIAQAMAMVAAHSTATAATAPTTCSATTTATKFGCVCIAERHTLQAAAARGKDYPTEHSNMLRKQKAGASWFISQAVYDPDPTIRLLKDYAALCRESGIPPAKVVLTFAPVSRPKTLQFVKWLGVQVPAATEAKILEAPVPVDASIQILCGILEEILASCVGIGVPLGISCESVSIFKAEIDGVHELFRRLQGILLDARGSPWKVCWVDIRMPPPNQQTEDDEKQQQLAVSPISTSRYVDASHLISVAVGGMLVAAGVLLGERRRSN